MTIDIQTRRNGLHAVRRRPGIARFERRAAEDDPSSVVLTLEQVTRITGRPRDLIREWARQGLLTIAEDGRGGYGFTLLGLLALAGDEDDREPLHHRLRAARLRRGLSQSDVARLIGTSQRMVAFWERGPDPDQWGRVHGKPIASRYVPLIIEWIDGRGASVSGRRASAPNTLGAIHSDC